MRTWGCQTRARSDLAANVACHQLLAGELIRELRRALRGLRTLLAKLLVELLLELLDRSRSGDLVVVPADALDHSPALTVRAGRSPTRLAVQDGPAGTGASCQILETLLKCHELLAPSGLLCLVF